jgi:hypothetical protein
MDGRAPHRTLGGDLEGLDEAQRVEVHTYEGGGPSDGVLLTDMARDRGEDFVEDDGASELVEGDLDALGMSVLTPDARGDDVVERDLDDEDLLDDNLRDDDDV